MLYIFFSIHQNFGQVIFQKNKKWINVFKIPETGQKTQTESFKISFSFFLIIKIHSVDLANILMIWKKFQVLFKTICKNIYIFKF